MRDLRSEIDASPEDVWQGADRLRRLPRMEPVHPVDSRQPGGRLAAEHPIEPPGAHEMNQALKRRAEVAS